MNEQQVLAIPTQERGFFGKTYDALTGETACKIYKGAAFVAAGVAIGIGGMMFCGNKTAEATETSAPTTPCDVNEDGIPIVSIV